MIKEQYLPALFVFELTALLALEGWYLEPEWSLIEVQYVSYFKGRVRFPCRDPLYFAVEYTNTSARQVRNKIWKEVME